MTTLAKLKTDRGDLTKYDPKQGLKHIAAAEAAEKHWARAKDAQHLSEAIRGKLEAQADFVTWWDTQITKLKGRPTNKSLSDLQGFRAGKNGLPDNVTICRWRKRLSDEESFEATYQAALARYIKILELDSTVHVGQNSGENEWYTPAELIEAARTVLGAIDLDPASTPAANRVVKATTFYTLKENGLDRDWIGRVWMNPPYAQPLVGHFAAKLAASVNAGDVAAAVVLVNNATETEWFTTIADVAAAACFPKGRVRFWSPKKEAAAPLQGQAVIYIGADTRSFAQAFTPFGLVFFKATTHGDTISSNT